MQMVKADVVEPRTGLVVYTCGGSDAEGGCPRVDESGQLPCAGLVLHAEARAVDWALQIPVPWSAQRCPLRGFAVASR